MYISKFLPIWVKSFLRYKPYLPDSLYLKQLFKRKLGRKLDLKNPQTFNEKLQWLKLYDRNPEYTKMVDKYEVKKYVANKIGEQYIIPTLGIWNKFEEIDFDTLPNQFVLKTTHDSGGVVICRNKDIFDYKAAKKKLKSSLKNNFYYLGREWPYKNVKPRIIAEKYMEDSSTKDLRDYKFFAFDGVVKALFIATDRQNQNEETKFDFYDSDFKHLDFTNGHPNSNIEIEKPQRFEEMKKLAEKLSEKIPQIRCDFYEINGNVYFGELTFFHWSGLPPFNPEEWDKTFGDWIKLPKANGGGGSMCIGSDYVLWLHVEKIASVSKTLTDYKFYCFNGVPKFLYISKGLENHATASISFVTLDWTFAPYGRSDYKPFDALPEKPSKFSEMIEICKKLSANHKFLRVDLYQINNQIYFSELTFSPCSGMMPFKTLEQDVKMGKLLSL